MLKRPYKTNETDYVDNQKFLEALFGSKEELAKPIIVSFTDNPNTAPKSAWFGYSWQHNNQLPSSTANNYVSLASFCPNEVGQYRRKKEHFVALHAIMLDDIGTKIPNDRITLTPSWRIETSPDNYQLGYILNEPLTNIALADSLMKSVIKVKLCDPGAGGPATRLARLPMGVNGKHLHPFQCRMTEWRPSLRYSPEEIIVGLGLTIAQPNPPKTKSQRQQSDRGQDIDSITIPRPMENPVLTVLHSHSFYKSSLGNGTHDITCPWVQEHTDAIDSGTAYFEPSASYPMGGFKCQHGHCNHRRTRDFLEFLNVDPQAALMKPIIRIRAGELHQVVEAAEKELAASGKYFQRGGLIVTVLTDSGTESTYIQESNSYSLLNDLARFAIWERYDRRNQEYTLIDLPERYVKVLYNAQSYRHLPILKGLARNPYLRDDYTLVTEAGYDSVSGMFGVFDTKEFIIPESPTREHADIALSMLEELLNEFCFASEVDRSAALLAILTAVIRSNLPCAPMMHIKAHQVGSGKSYLCEVITIFSTSEHSTPSSFPKDDEECRKMLLATLLRGPAVIEFDNLTSDILPHKSLCIALTSEHMTDRILGVSKTATVSTRTLFISSGNNVGPIQDMTRRCVTIHLDPACEIPATRSFKRPDLIEDIKRRRGIYVSAALIIIRAWIVAGRPHTQCSNLAGFKEWSDLCRQPLLWLGREDPVKSTFEAMASDPDREILGRLLVSWKANFDRRPAMIRDAVSLTSNPFSEETKDLREILHDIAGDRDVINRKSLGRWIKRHSGQLVNGLRFVRASGSRSAEAWLVESVSSVS